MRFDFTVYADNVTELDEALDAVRAAFPTDLFARNRGFTVTASPIPASILGAYTNANTSPPAPAVNATPAATAEAAKPRPRRTREQIAADEAAAPAKAKAAAAAPAADVDPLGQDEDADEGDAFDTDPAPAPAAPTLSPAQAKDAALAVLRELFALPGGPQQIKAIQAQFKIKKFVEVPDAQGHDLLKAAEENRALLTRT